jgi:hypothetical protein
MTLIVTLTILGQAVPMSRLIFSHPLRLSRPMSFRVLFSGGEAGAPVPTIIAAVVFRLAAGVSQRELFAIPRGFLGVPTMPVSKQLTPMLRQPL